MSRIKKIPFHQKTKRYRVNNDFLAALPYWIRYTIVTALKECGKEFDAEKKK